MRNFLVIVSVVGMILMSGCATNEGPEYEGSSYSQIKQVQIGTIISHRPVVISDTGAGSFLGAIVGGVLGSTIGGGDGSTLAALAGGLAGAYAGSEINKADAQELKVKLDDSSIVLVVTKGNEFLAGDRVRIVKDGNKVDLVEKLPKVD
jgi:outer membrane lipoprotein SlyB